jgi:branched-chain amino acid transport system substrate-binding protein
MRVTAGLIAGAFLFAACAGLSTARASGDVVKLGVINDQSGLAADTSGAGSVIATRMAVEDFGGKVLGKPIEVLSADHQNRTDIAMPIIGRWIDQEGVDALVDVSFTGISLATQELIRNRKRIALFNGTISAELTNKACSPYGIHWTLDSYALTHGLGDALSKPTGASWFFITQDSLFGSQLQQETAKVIQANGGTVAGEVRTPLGTTDFAQYLLQAQASGASVIAIATAGTELIDALKQASEFNMMKGKQRIAPISLQEPDVHSIGLNIVQGAYMVLAFNWNQNDATRSFSKRFWERAGHPPTQIQAGNYGAVMHYLKAVQAAGTLDADAVAAKMKEMPINDFMTKDGHIRADGRVEREMYLFQVKAPAESQGAWDEVKQVGIVPREKTVRPAAESDCPLMKK